MTAALDYNWSKYCLLNKNNPYLTKTLCMYTHTYSLCSYAYLDTDRLAIGSCEVANSLSFWSVTLSFSIVNVAPKPVLVRAVAKSPFFIYAAFRTYVGEGLPQSHDDK